VSGTQSHRCGHSLDAAHCVAVISKAGTCCEEQRPVIGSMETTMHRLTVLYPAKDGETFNYEYYFGSHHKLVVSRFKPEGMVSCEFDKGISDPAGDKAPYLAIAYLKFNSAEALQKALAKHGAEILGDIPNYTKIEPIMQVNEVLAS
jgi:uncharacterized protein (TIGR02118 family)